MLGLLREPLSCDYVLEQHHSPSALNHCLYVSSMNRHSPPLIIDLPDLAQVFDNAHLASRLSHRDRQPILIELNLHPLWLVDRSESIGFHIPQSAIRNPQCFSRFIVDQRIPPLREPRPRLYLDDVVEQRALEPELDLLSGGAQRPAPSGPRSGLCVAREQLQL